MRTVSLVLASALVFSAVSPSFAQEGVEAMRTAGARLEAEQALAQANAARPGDELLSCEQIQAQMGASMNTPEMRAGREEIVASAERQQVIQEEARQRQQSQMTTGVVAGIVGSFIPGAGYAQAAAMQAQASQHHAAGVESQQEMAGMIGNMTDMMPAMMRAQHLNELAQAQHCPFATETPPPR